MAHYKNFWDLQSSQAYSTHTVERFDDNTTTGGGTFKWIQANNASITNIAGFRIKPTSTTLGYWERETNGQSWNIDWVGCVNTSSQGTLASYGFTQPQLDTRYNNAGYSNTISTTDTYDTAAIKFAFNLMEQAFIFSLDFGKKEYYITSTCYLPRRSTSTTVREYDTYQIRGNYAQLKTYSTATSAFDMWSRVINNQTDALTQVNTQFDISNLLFRGSGAQKGIHFKCGYNSSFTNIVFQELANGLHLRFALGTYVSKLMAIGISGTVLNIDTGDPVVTGGWTGTTYGAATSQSNSTEVYKLRHFCQYNTATSIAVNGCSGVIINQPIVEGAQQNIGIAFDWKGCTAVKDFTINRAHIETTFVDSAISLRLGNSCKVNINGLFSQYTCTLLKTTTSAGYGNISVSNIEYVTAGSKFNDTSGGNIFWYFDRSTTIDPLDPTRWVGGTVPGSANTSYIVTQSSTNRVHDFMPYGSRS